MKSTISCQKFNSLISCLLPNISSLLSVKVLIIWAYKIENNRTFLSGYLQVTSNIWRKNSTSTDQSSMKIQAECKRFRVVNRKLANWMKKVIYIINEYYWKEINILEKEQNCVSCAILRLGETALAKSTKKM